MGSAAFEDVASYDVPEGEKKKSKETSDLEEDSSKKCEEAVDEHHSRCK